MKPSGEKAVGETVGRHYTCRSPCDFYRHPRKQNDKGFYSKTTKESSFSTKRTICSNMVFEIERTLWHNVLLGDTSAERIFWLMDIFTDKSEIWISNPENASSLSLRIRARNSFFNREIAASEGTGRFSNRLFVNLGSLQDFPDIPERYKERYKDNQNDNENNRGIKHIELEIEYTTFERKKRYSHVTQEVTHLRDLPATQQITILLLSGMVFWTKLIESIILPPKREKIMEQSGKIHTDFFITLPMGWKMANDEIMARYGIPRLDSDGFDSKPIFEVQSKVSPLEEGRKTYNLTIYPEKYEEIQTDIEQFEEEKEKNK